VIYRLQIIWSV